MRGSLRATASLPPLTPTLSAVSAREERAETPLQRLVRELRDGDAVGQLQRRLEAVGQPASRDRPCLHDDAVHHHVDVVLVFLVELGRLGDLVELRR